MKWHLLKCGNVTTVKNNIYCIVEGQKIIIFIKITQIIFFRDSTIYANIAPLFW